jgi:nitrate reductase gamma subunit
MNTHATTAKTTQSDEQLLYARWLEWGTRLGLVALVALFAAYASGLLPPQVPLDQLPNLWNQPVDAYLRATGAPSGWQWVHRLGQGDVANLLGIAIMAGCSVLCLLALLPLALRRGDRLLAALCLAEAAVVVLAASGVIGSAH